MNQVICESDIRHHNAVQSIIFAVRGAVDLAFEPFGINTHGDGMTHDIVYDKLRPNMLEPVIARTSAVHCIKEYFREISKPIIDTMFIATDSRPQKHGSKGPRC